MVVKLASVVGLGCVMFLVGCGGSAPAPQAPPTDDPEEEEVSDESWETGPAPSPEGSEAETDEASSESPDEARKAPEFKEGMSVNDAIAAVPSHYEYIGIEPEVLAKPLMDIATYKECKVTQATHFAVKVAVWDGRVVGADVEAKGNKVLAACIDGVVRKIEYKERVESINTVEFSF